jgi:cytochrome c biogenesis protein CcdA
MGSMLAISMLVMSLAIADSINPITIAIAIYLVSTPSPRRRLASYAIGVFSVYLAGGLLFVLGPGELLRIAAAGSRTRSFYAASLVIGSLVIVVGAVLWARRERWSRLRLPEWALRTKSSFALGAAVTAFDLPTAFPYFAAIGAIVSSDLTLPGQVLLLVVFNALYVLPLIAVLIAHSLFGERAETHLARARDVIERLSPVVLTVLTIGAGIALVIRGANGLAGP